MSTLWFLFILLYIDSRTIGKCIYITIFLTLNFKIMNSKNFFSITASILLGFSLIFQSCQKEQNEDAATEETVYDIVDKAAFNVESDANSGKFGCFEFVYPIGFYLPKCGQQR
jgi:hypothetical protein